MRKKNRQNEAIGFSAESGRVPRLTPADVQQKEFRVAFRGYHERDVDEFLDMVTEELSAHIEENMRLRQQAGLPQAGVARVPPLGGDATEEADEIVARARREASDIVRNAEVKVAAMLAAAGAGQGDLRASIAPYLNREREFLQSLGKLVQGHAEAVRSMVEAARGAHAASRRAGPPEESVAPAPSQQEVASADPAAVPAEPLWTPPADSSEPMAAASTGPPAEPDVEVIDVADADESAEAEAQEEATATARQGAGAPLFESGAGGGAAGEPADRSLRDLFWGED